MNIIRKIKEYLYNKVLTDAVMSAVRADMRAKDRQIVRHKEERDQVYADLQKAESALNEALAECRGLKYAARQKIVIQK